MSGDIDITPVPRRRWRRRTGVLGVVLAVPAAVLLLLVLSVPVDATPSGDAVIVHAGGRGERLETALDLMADDAAPVLVVMYLGIEEYPDSTGLCGRTEPYEVLCPAPQPVTTIGEARHIGELATLRGWDELVIVTTDYHVRRAKWLDDKCTDADVQAAAAGHQLGIVAHAERVAHEMLGLVQAALFSC